MCPRSVGVNDYDVPDWEEPPMRSRLPAARIGVVALMFVFVLLSACASTEKKKPVVAKTKETVVTSRLEGDPAWIELDRLAQKRGFLRAGSTKEGRIRLRKSATEVQIDPQSRVSYFDGRLVMMTIRPREDGGRLYVSSTLDAEFLELERLALQKTTVATKPLPSGRLAHAHFVLDAGHGGKDAGASRGQVREKDLVLDITKKVGAMLEAAGARVTYTRRDDRFIELDDRAAISNDANPTAFVSIHVNAAGNTRARGVEVYVPKYRLRGQATDKLVQSKALGVALLRRLEEATPGKDRGLKTSPGFRVLKYNDHPAVLLELGFVSNTDERARLANAIYRKRLAEAIVAGLRDYLARRSPDRS